MVLSKPFQTLLYGIVGEMFSIDLESIWIFSVIVRRFLTDDVILPLGAQRPESIARMYTVLTKDACYTLLYIWVNVIQ